MCSETDGCRKPEHLRGKPEECSAKQIQECHGDAREHPCVSASGRREPGEREGKPEERSPK